VGLRELWQRFHDGQDQRKLDKLTRRLCEKYSQDYERYAAADELGALPGEEPIYRLLHRFDVLTAKIGEDENEKKYVFDLVLAKGEAAIPAILRYIRNKDNLVYPLRLLMAIAGPEKSYGILTGILSSEFSPDYNRVPEKKKEIIQTLRDFADPAVVAVLLPFLKDPNDDVVLSAMEILAAHGDSSETIRDAFAEMLISDEEKPRLKRRTAEIFKERRWKVTGFRKKAEEILPEGFYLDKKGYVKQVGE